MLRLLFASALSLAFALGAPTRCTTGALLASLDLKVVPPGGGEPLGLRDVNVVPKGARLVYSPGRLPLEKAGKARVALLIAPAAPGGAVVITDAKPAGEPAEWEVPARAGVVALVFGPQGLDRKKVRRLVGKDADLMVQLAEYAEKSTQAENLLQALMEYERQPGSRENMEAALTGFAGAWRLPNSRLDRNKPLDEQAALMLRTLNPALAAVDPLAPQGTTRYQQTAGLAASVAGLFWGNTVGIAAGSTALFMNLRTMMFPNTDVRSSFVQSGPDRLALCAPREAQKPRTRVAYLWAVKIPDLDSPSLALARTAHVAGGLRQTVTLKDTTLEGRFLLRARNWRLAPEGGGDGFPVRALPGSASGALSSLQLDLGDVRPPPGEYRLYARWDWTELEVAGPVQVHRIGPLASASVTPESADRLVAGTGAVVLDVTGADFQFVEKASLTRDGEAVPRTVGLEILSANGAGPGPKPSLHVAVDTSSLAAGRYRMKLEQAGGHSTEIPVRILPPPPVLEGLPVRVNLGEPEQVVTLRGRGLDRLEAVVAEDASVEVLGGGSTRREVRVRLAESVREGGRISVRLKVEGMNAELPVENALRVAGPRPRVLDVSSSAPPETHVDVHAGELVAGVPRSFLIRASGLDGPASVRVSCEEASQNLGPVSLRSGEERDAAALQRTGADTLFLSMEPGRIGSPGCRLTLVIETGGEGASDPAALGRVVRLPRIEKFEFTEEKLASGLWLAVLEGYELDTIAQTGWKCEEGFPVLGLPSPVPGQASRQTLRIALPWSAPSPRAPLYVFLHGEATGRLTKSTL